MNDQQINVRVDIETSKALDKARVKLSDKLGKIPSRSEVVRIALDEYLARLARGK